MELRQLEYFREIADTGSINEAARRLTSGDCNLTVLYADLGYTNPTSFRRAFKKYYGMTPSEMRDQPRRQEEKSE